MSSLKYHNGQIHQLNPNEIFVYGANLDGFNGAGAAGFASFNMHGNRWRELN